MMTELVLFLLTKKKQGKNYFPIIGKVVAILLFATGIFYLIVDLENDINVGKTQAQIIDYAQNQYGYERPIVEYNINNKKYQVQIEILTEEFRNSNIGDTVKINYNKKNPSELAYFSYYEELYIPCFLISIVLFIVGKKSKNNKEKHK